MTTTSHIQTTTTDWKAIVATGNDRHDYRVIMNDTDAGKNVTMLFADSIETAHKAAKEFDYTANQSHNT